MSLEHTPNNMEFRSMYRENERLRDMGRRRRRRKNGSRLITAYMVRAIIILILLFLVFRTGKSIAGILTRARNSGAPMTQEQGPQPAGTESTAQETETATEAPKDPNIVTSNGRELDLRKPMVALTFDDGPYPSVGNQIMDLMDSVGGRATFFVVGNRVNHFSEEMQRMANEGHEIGNHSFDHDEKLSKKGADYIKWEFQACNDAVAAVTGVTPEVIRLPGGIITDAVRTNVTMPMIHWSVDTEDWKTRNAQSTIAAIMGHVQDGDIVLMHELYPATAEACHTVIPQLAAQGFQLVTVSELIQFKRGSDPLDLTKQYPSFRPEVPLQPGTEPAADTAGADASGTDENTSADSAGGGADQPAGNADDAGMQAPTADPAAETTLAPPAEGAAADATGVWNAAHID